jgi:hypothetical protein
MSILDWLKPSEIPLYALVMDRVENTIFISSSPVACAHYLAMGLALLHVHEAVA